MRLTKEGCRARQMRLVEILETEGLDGALISRREHVYYFSGYQRSRHHSAALLLQVDGRSVLASAEEGIEGLAVDESIPYAPDRLCTMHSRQHQAAAEALQPAVKEGRYGSDLGGGIACVSALGGGEVFDLSPAIRRLRKCKLPDEIEAMRDAIRLTDVIYEAASGIIGPGVDEMTVFSEIQAAATRAAGEFLEDFGNDFRANDLGGKPRRRIMNAGELYILDAGPVLHGYYADNCRTFAVDGTPTDAQLNAWDRIDSIFAVLEEKIRPGVRAVDLFKIADEYMHWEGFTGMVHHLGHGVGLGPHEAPELNPHYSAVFEVGDFFTMEPGLYSEDLKAGIRIEENYLVTKDGIEKLTTYPRGLV